VKRDGGIRPYDPEDFYYRLKERLDANSEALGERLDRGKGNRLDNRTQDRPYKDLVRALLEAKQKRPAYGGPR